MEPIENPGEGITIIDFGVIDVELIRSAPELQYMHEAARSFFQNQKHPFENSAGFRMFLRERGREGYPELVDEDGKPISFGNYYKYALSRRGDLDVEPIKRLMGVYQKHAYAQGRLYEDYHFITEVYVQAAAFDNAAGFYGQWLADIKKISKQRQILNSKGMDWERMDGETQHLFLVVDPHTADWLSGVFLTLENEIPQEDLLRLSLELSVLKDHYNNSPRDTDNPVFYR